VSGLNGNLSLGTSAEPQLTAPILKWAGGKRSIANQILPLFGPVNGIYYEPFFGGGAMFFALRPEKANLSDVNHELISCYQAIKDDPVGVADRLSALRNDKETYYRVRKSCPTSTLGKASRLIYLTTLSFNGIYRQNLNGEFNVPYGYKLSKRLPGREELRRASAALSQAHLCAKDFETATDSAASGDTIYFDPPYTVVHNNNGFVKYNASIFSWKDQERLAKHASSLADRGCNVFVSNADHCALRELYKDFNCHTIKRYSVIAASSQNRREITECLFYRVSS
jgi:DNA adenine methylase